jgi:PAS domain S-box-containing protein
MPDATKTSPSSLTDLLFDKIGVGLCLVAPDSTIVRANGEWLRSTGYTEDQVIGENIINLFPATRHMALALHARARAGHRIEVPRYGQTLNGRETWWEGSIEPVTMEGGTGLLITAREVSEFRVFYESAPAAFLVLAPDRPRFTIVAVSEAYLRATKTTRDIVGRGIFEVFPDNPDDPASTGSPARASFERVLQTGMPDTMAVQKHSLRRSREEGGGFEERYWSPINTPVLGEHRRVMFIHHRVEDVTQFVRQQQRKGAEHEAIAETLRTQAGVMEADVLRRAQEIQEVNRWLRVLADSLPQLAWTARPDGFITWFNRRCYEYTGATREQLEGWGWQSVHDPAALPDVLRAWDDAIKKGLAFEIEFPLRGADGKFRRFLSRASPLKDDHGNVIQWFGTHTDVTTLVEAQEALRNADRRKDEFLGMLSHELRNPLAPIRNASFILRHAEPGGGQVRHAQDVIERQVGHLTRLVDDLLDVTRVARGKIELRRSRIDLRDVVLQAADDFRMLLQGRGVRFEVVISEEKLWADADATRITQVVGNLLHNAAKFTQRGNEVAIRMGAVEGAAEIRIRDTGAGIEPSLLPRIFDAFVQGDRTLARTEGGLGLGLALVKGITELHGGIVRAESAGKGEGAEFVIRLPLLAAPEARSAPTPPAQRRNAQRVLIVDDNADAADTLAEIVKMLGHTVDVAYDGPSAIEKVRASRPDVVLCDIGLPGMSGYEVARRLRASGVNGAKLIAVSGYAQSEDVSKATEAGFDGHVAKPCNLERIEKLLS